MKNTHFYVASVYQWILHIMEITFNSANAISKDISEWNAWLTRDAIQFESSDYQKECYANRIKWNRFIWNWIWMQMHHMPQIFANISFPYGWHLALFVEFVFNLFLVDIFVFLTFSSLPCAYFLVCKMVCHFYEHCAVGKMVCRKKPLMNIIYAHFLESRTFAHTKSLLIQTECVSV